MEWLLVAAAFAVFIVLPISMCYDMIFNPEQFAPAGLTRTDELPDYKSDAYDDAMEFYLPVTLLYVFVLIPSAIGIYIWFAVAAVFRGIWWFLTGEFMAKDRWFERYSNNNDKSPIVS